MAKDAPPPLPSSASAPLSQDHIVNHIKGLLNELALGGAPAPLAAPAAVDADVADRDPAAVSDLGEGDGRPEVAHLLGAVQQAEGRPAAGQTETGLGGDVTDDETDGDADNFGQDSDSDSDDYDAKAPEGGGAGMGTGKGTGTRGCRTSAAEDDNIVAQYRSNFER